MHKILVLYPFPQDAKKFRPYYEDVHVKLVEKLPGLKACRYSFDVGAEGGGASPFYCVFEAEFDSLQAMGAAMGSPEGQAVVGDVTNFATTPATVVHYEVAD